MSLFRERAKTAECAQLLPLHGYSPQLVLERLLPGIDNLRQDVYLSPKFMHAARQHIARLVAQYGDVKDLVAEPAALSVRAPSVVTAESGQHARAADTSEFKEALADLLTAAVTRAKHEGNLAIDMLCRLAVLKALKSEMAAQFAETLNRCRARAKAYEGPRQGNVQRGIALRERAARFQMAKKAILRKIGQELFATLRELEKTTLARMRRSLCGDAADADYELFLNRLLFTEEGRDDFINAEHYVMLGNYERDPDRVGPVRDIACGFLAALGYGERREDGPPPTSDSELDSLLNVPENAQTLLAGGEADEATPEGRMQKAVMTAWLEQLEQENIMQHVLASYEAAPLLNEYCPPIHPQQLKHALISRAECRRVERLLEEHGKLSVEGLHGAVRRVEHARGGERTKIAARFFKDLMRYLRDLRRLEALTAALDKVNLITSEKLRELSAINHTLYEFSLAEEQKPVDARVVHHVIVKADIRDSTLLIRTLYDRGLNPASHFSLNFYEPINKLLTKYGAQKLFIEGDAVILALLEREGEPGFGVGRACGLAKEIIEIMRGHNEESQKAGLPGLELGIGISYQDTAPMYLVDGTTQIMISPALNTSDRLSSCSKSARRFCAGVESLFNVFAFQTIDDADTAGQPEEFLIRYNIGGIVLDEAGFEKLRQEILLTTHEVQLPTLWDEGRVRLYSGTVPVGPGIFHQLIVREARVPHIDAREFQLKDLTERRYYEVCTNPAVYEFLRLHHSATAGQ